LDNAIDCLIALPVAVGLGLSGYVRFDICFLSLSLYTMISALTFLRANVTDVFQISYGGAGPTEMRIATASLNTLVFFCPPSAFQIIGLTLKYPDLIALGWCASAVISFLVCMTIQVRQLAIEEPARPAAAESGEKAEWIISREIDREQGSKGLGYTQAPR
jgi:hypothetical protein